MTELDKTQIRELGRFYDTHPINARRVLARVHQSRAQRRALTESDLAGNADLDSTDQNHIGGTRFIEGLARLSGISKSSKVLDLGSGVGGSARYLAQKYGCQVDGIDVSAKRTADARKLTKMVGLQYLVNVRQDDMINMRLPSKRYDVVWGQGAWDHVRDKRAFLQKWTRVLNRRGAFAIEDVYIRNEPRSFGERQKLEDLSKIWRGYFLDRRRWVAILHDLAFGVVTRDLTFFAKVYCRKQLKILRRSAGFSDEEKLGYAYFDYLADRKIVGYLRIVAQLR